MEAFLADCRVTSWILNGEIEKQHKNSVAIVGLLAEISSRDFWNIK
jgi:hypothetical protein